MSIIVENNLKHEEIFGGFEPDKDDDSFFLEEDDSFAPVILDFTENVRELNPSNSSPIPILIQQEPFANIEPEAEDLPIDVDIDLGENIDNSEIPDNEMKSDDISEVQIDSRDNEIIDNSDLNNQNYEQISEPEEHSMEPNMFDELFQEQESQPEERAISDRPFKLDDDILGLIESDLASPRRRKEVEKDDIPEFSEENNEQGLNDFKSVDNAPGAEFIDITGISAVHPSTFQNNEFSDSDEIPPVFIPQEPVIVNRGDISYKDIVQDQNLKTGKNEEKEKEKKKKRNPFLIYGLIAAGLLIAAIALTGYYFLVYKGMNPFKATGKKIESQNLLKQENNKKEKLFKKILQIKFIYL